MSLSNANVRQLLNDEFACAWSNTEGDANSGVSFAHAPSDPPGPCLRGNGEHNIQMLILTPQGRLLSVLSGYVGPEELEEELKFALRLYRAIGKQSDDRQRVRTLVAEHRGVTAKPTSHAGDNPFMQFAGPFAAPAVTAIEPFIRQRSRLDHEYSIAHPLQPVSEFRSEDLVGSGPSFFGSFNNSIPGQTIGGRSAQNRAGRR